MFKGNFIKFDAYFKNKMVLKSMTYASTLQIREETKNI